jgi:hypothetical protein
VLPNLPTVPTGWKRRFRVSNVRADRIVLQVAATPTINVVLAIGTLDETVSVEAAAPLVDVKSAGSVTSWTTSGSWSCRCRDDR